MSNLATALSNLAERQPELRETLEPLLREARRGGDWEVLEVVKSPRSGVMFRGINHASGGEPFAWHVNKWSVNDDRYDFSKAKFEPGVERWLEAWGWKGKTAKAHPLDEDPRIGIRIELIKVLRDAMRVVDKGAYSPEGIWRSLKGFRATDLQPKEATLLTTIRAYLKRARRPDDRGQDSYAFAREEMETLQNMLQRFDVAKLASSDGGARRRLLRLAHADPRYRPVLLPLFKRSKEIEIDWDKVEHRLYDRAHPRPPHKNAVRARIVRVLHDEAKFGTIDQSEIKELLKAFDALAKKSRGALGDKGVYWVEKDNRRMTQEEIIAQIQPDAVIK